MILVQKHLAQGTEIPPPPSVLSLLYLENDFLSYAVVRLLCQFFSMKFLNSMPQNRFLPHTLWVFDFCGMTMRGWG